MARRTSRSCRFSSGIIEKPSGPLTVPRSRILEAVPAAVLARGVHEPLDAVRVGARRQLAGGGQHEARAAPHGVEAPPDLVFDLAARGALEDRDVDVAD